MTSKEQLKRLHATYGKLKSTRPEVYDDAWMRLALRNVGKVAPDCTGHVSSKSLSNFGFEDVMALMEGELERNRIETGTYWRDIVARRTGFATSRQVHLVHQLAANVPYPLEALCLKHSDGRHKSPDKLTPRQIASLIEMMNGVIARAEKKHAGDAEGGTASGDTACCSQNDSAPGQPVNNKLSQMEARA